jgi:hypothetical protein
VLPEGQGLVDPDLEGLFLDNCANSCHASDAGGAPEDLVEYTKNMPPARLYDLIANGSKAGGMGPQGEFLGVHTMVYLTQQPEHVHQMVYEDPATGLAHLTAMNIVDNVFEELTGQHLVTGTGFPRNTFAAQTLDHLTHVFVEEGWSLKALIREIVLTQFANRHAPQDSLLADAYPLPMVVNPYADVPGYGVEPGEDENSTGDLVHRWSIPSLLSQVHHALLWPEPPRFPGNNGYADLAFQEEMGAFQSRGVRGFPDLVLPSLLNWEDEIARCSPPAGVDTDFVDLLTDPAFDLTLEEAMLAVKERLVSHTAWWGDPDVEGGDGVLVLEPVGEHALATDLAGVSLSEPAWEHPGAVRDYCAAVLQSPYFLMAGIPAWSVDAPPPTPVGSLPCPEGERCSWTEHCEHFAAEAEGLGHRALSCEPYKTTLTTTR